MKKKVVDRSLEKTIQLIDFEGKDPSIFYDNYVTFRSFKDRRIVCYGKNLPAVLKETEEVKGIKHPGLIYLPNPNRSHIYSLAELQCLKQIL